MPLFFHIALRATRPPQDVFKPYATRRRLACAAAYLLEFPRPPCINSNISNLGSTPDVGCRIGLVGGALEFIGGGVPLIVVECIVTVLELVGGADRLLVCYRTLASRADFFALCKLYRGPYG